MDVEYKNKLLEMLNYLDSVCRDNQLRYYAIGGTLLGAVRHKGFIPWDNDIDVAMPRKDYNRFASIVNEDYSQYVVETPQSDAKDFLYSVAKLYDTSTTLIENLKVKTKRGVYVDVFPIDGIGNSPNEIEKNYKKIDIINKFLASRTCVVRPQRKWWKNVAIILANIFPESVFNTKKILMKLDKMCSERDFDNYKYVGVLLTQYGQKYIMPKELFDKTDRYKFEDTTVRSVADFDKYLSLLFGDWNVLPPKEKRVEGHDYLYIDLEHSYLED